MAWGTASASQPPVPWQYLAGFFAWAHGWSWLCWGLAMQWDGLVWDTPGRWLIYLGGLGPLLGGLAMTRLTYGRAGLRTLWNRLWDPRRIPTPWLAAALLLPVGFMAGAVGLWVVFGDISPHVTVDWTRLTDPIGLLGFAVFVFLFGPLPEEIGWRGYALDALQSRFSALTASLILGLAWGLWHAPLFAVAGYYGPDGSPDPLLFLTAIVITTILITWVYNNTRRSVLVAVLFHFMNNYVGMLIEGTDAVEWTRTGLAALTVIIALAVWGPATLRRRPIRRATPATA